MNIVMDESSQSFYGFGGLFVDYLKDKTVSRGAQIVLMMDCDWFRPHGWLHRQKSYEKAYRFTTNGQSEVYHILTKHVLPNIGEEKLWPTGPYLTADNYFNGDRILDWMGENGLGMIGTVARIRLQKERWLMKVLWWKRKLTQSIYTRKRHQPMLALVLKEWHNHSQW